MLFQIGEKCNRFFSIANTVCALQAGSYVPLDRRSFCIVERTQGKELGQLTNVAAHVVSLALRALPRRRKPSEIRLFAVPSGSPSWAAISA